MLCGRPIGLNRWSTHKMHVADAAAAPLVSVVIPCFNAEATLAAALGSVLAQTHTALQVLLVDDGSSDRSLRVAAGYDDARLRVITQPNRGVSAARNRGLSEASGVLVQYLDADDVLEPGKIAAQVALWQQHGDRAVYACAYRRFKQVPGDRVPSAPAPTALSNPSAWICDTWLRGTMLPPHAWLVPMALCRAAGAWDESLLQNEDGEYFARVLTAAEQVHHLPEVLCHYRYNRAGSVSGSASAAARASRLRSYDLSVTHLRARDPGAIDRLAVATLYRSLALDCALDQPGLAAQALAVANRYHRGARITGRGRAFTIVSALLGWRVASYWRQHWLAITSRYKTG